MPLSVVQTHIFSLCGSGLKHKVLLFFRLYSNTASCGHCSEIAQDGTWMVHSLWEGPADTCFWFWGEEKVFLPVYCTQHPVRTVGPPWLLRVTRSFSSSSSHCRYSHDPHFTPSTRVKVEFGKGLLLQQSSRERSKAEPGWQMPKWPRKMSLLVWLRQSRTQPNTANIKYLLKKKQSRAKSLIAPAVLPLTIFSPNVIPPDSTNFWRLTNLLVCSLCGRSGMTSSFVPATGHLQDWTSLFISVLLSLPLPFCFVCLAI